MPHNFNSGTGNQINSNEFSKYAFLNADKEFLLLLLHIQRLGRRTAASVLLYLKKHEIKNEDFWVVFQSLVINNTNLKNKLKSIKKEVLEQLYYSTKNLLETEQVRVIAFWEKEYPKLLQHTDDFPLLLFVKGNSALLQTKAVAVVGTRKVTSYGELVTKKLVSELVASEYTIISGCMYGVDAVAHQEAIDSGGKTIAVLGYGFGHSTSYDISNLQERIITSGGCLVTEYLPPIRPNKGTFPERNRIVAGMSLGVLVTEAALKSGTHITAECALEAGRDVFAVPGSIFNPFTEGTRYLLNQGAKLVSSAQDIVAEFRKVITIPDSQGQTGKVIDIDTVIRELELDEVSQTIVRELIFLPQTTDELLKKTHLSIQELLTVLSVLELENIVENEAGVWRCVLLYSGHAK